MPAQCAAGAECDGAAADASPFAALVGWAQRYGTTPENISNREAARAAIFGRGGEAASGMWGVRNRG